MLVETVTDICINTIPKLYYFWAAWKKTSVAESAETLHSEDIQAFMHNLEFNAYYETFIVVPHINCVSLVKSHIGVGYGKPVAITMVIWAGTE